MDNQPKVILLCGPPCSGKSTWIKNNNQDNLDVLSTDTFIEEESKKLGKTYSEGFNELIKPAVFKLAEDLELYTKEKKSFIVDQTNVNPKSRRKKLRYCEGYYKVAVYLEVPLNIILQRNTQRPGKVVPENVLKSMVETYQRPILEEGFDLIIDGATNTTGPNDNQNQLLYDIILDI